MLLPRQRLLFFQAGCSVAVDPAFASFLRLPAGQMLAELAAVFHAVLLSAVVVESL